MVPCCLMLIADGNTEVAVRNGDSTPLTGVLCICSKKLPILLILYLFLRASDIVDSDIVDRSRRSYLQLGLRLG